MFAAPIRWLLLRDRTIGGGNATDDDETVERTFQDMAVYPDSEVTVATRSLEVEDGSMGAWQITSVYRPSPFRELLTENRGTWTADRGVRPVDLRPTSRRRRDLRRTPLKSCLVVGSLEHRARDRRSRSENYRSPPVDLRNKAAGDRYRGGRRARSSGFCLGLSGRR